MLTTAVYPRLTTATKHIQYPLLPRFNSYYYPRLVTVPIAVASRKSQVAVAVTVITVTVAIAVTVAYLYDILWCKCLRSYRDRACDRCSYPWFMLIWQLDGFAPLSISFFNNNNNEIIQPCAAFHLLFRIRTAVLS